MTTDFSQNTSMEKDEKEEGESREETKKWEEEKERGAPPGTNMWL